MFVGFEWIDNNNGGRNNDKPQFDTRTYIRALNILEQPAGDLIFLQLQENVLEIYCGK